MQAKQRTRVAMGLKIAHFSPVKTLDDFEFKFQPSVAQRLVRERAIARFLAQAENVLIFGALASAKRISRSPSGAPSSKPATPFSSRASPHSWRRCPKPKPMGS